MKTPTITQFANIAAGRFPEDCTDLRSVSRGDRTIYFSPADKARGSVRIPTRDKHGRRLSAIWDEIKSEKRRTKFAEHHNWPFLIHVENT